MPFLDLPHHRLHYRIDGAEGRPWLVFCNSLGTDLHLWDAQIEAFGARFRVLRYDRRGHGESTAPPGPFTIADLGRDVLALLDHLSIGRTHFCGLSIGGLTAQWLGLNAPERLHRMVVCSTAAKIGTPEVWSARIAHVREHGLASLVEATVQRWFSPSFVAAHPDQIARIAASFLRTSTPTYLAACEALAATDFREQLPQVTVPTLAVSGDDDAVTTPDDLRFIASRVANGRSVSLPGRHIVNRESAQAFNTAVLDFLRE